MGFKDRPSFLGAQVEVIYKDSPAGLEHAPRFKYVFVAIPLVEMHKDNRAIDQIDGGVWDRREIEAGDLDEADVLESRQALSRVLEHPRRDIAADPLFTDRCKRLANPADTTSDLEDGIIWLDADGLLQPGSGVLSSSENVVFGDVADHMDRRRLIGF